MNEKQDKEVLEKGQLEENLDRLCVAPMMEYSDSFFRTFFRLMSKNTTLYTEMITANHVMHAETEFLSRFLGPYDPLTVVQVAGCCPETVSQAVQRINRELGFSSFNLNVGCPSRKAQRGGFGAVLMTDPKLVKDIAARVFVESPEVTMSVKCRLGVNKDGPEKLLEFVDCVSAAGVRRFVVHARIGLLQFRRTIHNCKIPPLDYEAVVEASKKRPTIEFVLNGGISSLQYASSISQTGLHGAMIGRKAFADPFMFLEADSFFPGGTTKQRAEVLQKYVANLRAATLTPKSYLHAIKPLVASVHGMRFAGDFRKLLFSGRSRPEAIAETVDEGVRLLRKHLIDFYSGTDDGKNFDESLSP